MDYLYQLIALIFFFYFQTFMGWLQRI